MTVLGTIYNSMSGLTAFSNGLNNISNNIANLNTPGYKRSDLNFRDFGYQYNINYTAEKNYTSNQIGKGVVAEQTSINFSQGEIRDTGNDTDLALDGPGFFILQDVDSEEQLYTRIGQFEFNPEGFLVNTDSGMRVMAIDDREELVAININDLRSQDPQITTTISFVGNLSSGANSHTINDVEIFDEDGGSHQLNITFTNNSVNIDRSWLVQIRDENDDIILQDGEIRFNGNASPAEGYNSLTATLSGTDFPEFSVELQFGDPGTFSQLTNFSTGTSSTAAFDQQDGYAPGILKEFTIDQDGYIDVTYSNDQSEKTDRIAVANFDNPQQLIRLSAGYFLPQADQQVRVGAAGELGNGKISSRNLELSNVELTEQFTDMIVIQRGYQASSQLLTVSNEMIQQLIDSTKAG
jgi:flagellar hook protein FlgE